MLMHDQALTPPISPPPAVGRQGDLDLIYGQLAISQAALAAARDALDRLASSPSLGQATAPPPPRQAPPTMTQPRGLWMDPTGGEVLVNGRRIDDLTSLEYSLLRLLYKQPGRLCAKEDIVRQVWGVEQRQEGALADVEAARVEKLVSRLRGKIEPVPGRPQFLRTVRGRGYRYMPLS